MLLALSLSAFGTNKPMNLATQADLQALTQKIQKEMIDNNELQRQSLQQALDKIQKNTQQQINLLANQITTLSKQTAQAVMVLHKKLALLNVSNPTETEKNR
jgi:histidinol dehydrogenase